MIQPESFCHREHQPFRRADLPRRSPHRHPSTPVPPSSRRNVRPCCHRTSRPHRSCIPCRSPQVPPRFCPKLKPARICSRPRMRLRIREFRRRFDPASSGKRDSAPHHSAEAIAGARTGGKHEENAVADYASGGGQRAIRFHSEMALLGIARHFRSYFSHPNLELRVILNSWKTPPSLRP